MTLVCLSAFGMCRLQTFRQVGLEIMEERYISKLRLFYNSTEDWAITSKTMEFDFWAVSVWRLDVVCIDVDALLFYSVHGCKYLPTRCSMDLYESWQACQ